MAGCSGDFDIEGVGSDVCDAISTASRHQQPTTKLDRFDLGTHDVDRYEGKDGGYADEHEQEEGLQANDGSTHNVAHYVYGRLNLKTDDVDGYECEHGEDAGSDEEEYLSQADDRSMPNVEY